MAGLVLMPTTLHRDTDFHSRISIWADVATSKGFQMVKDGFITERDRATASSSLVKMTSDSHTIIVVSRLLK